LLAEMDALTKEVRGAREALVRDNSSLEQAAKAAKALPKKAEPQPLVAPKDLSQTLQSHRLRCEIERAFFFHVTYELLRDRFGDHGVAANFDELKLFERLGNEVSLTSKLEEVSSDLQATAQARRDFEKLPNRDRLLKQREEQSIIYKPGTSGQKMRANSYAGSEDDADDSTLL
jgi:hypothetical protein